MSFERFEGFQGSAPQKFVDTNIPKCPFCGTDNPHWGIQAIKGEFWTLNAEANANKLQCRCEQCHGIMQMPMTDVAGVGRSSLLSWQGLQKKQQGKNVNAVYVTLIEAGNVNMHGLSVDKEYTLDEVNSIAQQTD